MLNIWQTEWGAYGIFYTYLCNVLYTHNCFKIKINVKILFKQSIMDWLYPPPPALQIHMFMPLTPNMIILKLGSLHK